MIDHQVMTKAMNEIPEAIMIHVPNSFFMERSERAFRNYYEHMHLHKSGCFYHFISTVPVHEVTTCYVCFHGKIQYKAVVVEYLRNTKPFPDFEQRNWLVLTGPVEKPPHEIPMRGFRGFRYTQHLWSII